MKVQKYGWIIGILVVCAAALSADVTSLEKILRTGRVWFTQEFALDDDAMPADIFFDSPSTICCDPEGNIYVADSGANNVKKFDAQGMFLKTIGREGQGPGELGGLYYSTFAKDRLILWDSGNRRLTAFTPDGEFITSAGIPYEQGSVRKLRGFPTGEVAVEMEKNYRREPDKPQVCTIDLYSPDLKRVRNIYKRSLWRKKYVRTKEFGISTLYFPYATDIRWDVTPDGRIVVGFSENYELEIYDLSGKKINTIEHTHKPVKVTEQDKKDYFESLNFYMMGERLKETPDYITKQTEFPKHKPVYNDILVDSEGNFWVVLNTEQKRENGKIFDAFDPEGRFISRVQINGDILLPANRNAYLIHDGSLLLLKTGDDELYRMIRYKITDR